MESTDVKVFSVIVKIWVEASVQPTWHGRVTHIPSGEDHYVSQVEDVAVVISRYLAAFGFKPRMCVRVWRWLRQRRSS